MKPRFQDQNVVITGGAKGIGKACVLRLLAEGGTAHVLDAEPETSEWVQKLRTEAGADIDRLFYQQVDLTDPQQVATAFTAIYANTERVHALVNNVGFGTNNKPIEEFTVDEFKRFIDINLLTAFLCSKEVVPAMRRQGGGSIVNMSSVTGRSVSRIANIPYTSSKAAIMGFSRKLAQEEGEHNIRVNAIAPGTVFTERVKARYDALGDEERNRRIEAYALRRAAEPREIAAAILFLASDDASYITGAVLDVNGGQFMG